MIEALQFGFMQRALVAGIFVAVACALLGVFLVLRRCAMMGEGLAHFAFGSVGLALLLSLPPLAVAVPLAVLASLLILKLPERGGMFGDAAIGMVSAVGVAAGVLFAGLGGGFNIDLFSYLFGDILAVTRSEVAVAVGLSAAAGAVLLHFRRQLFAMAFDAEHARTAGVPVKKLDRALAALTALTVVLGIRVVGTLLVSSLLIFPAATALQVARSFRGALAVAAAVGATSIVAGIAAAYAFDVPAGSAIVLVNAVAFVVARLARRA